MKNKKRLPAAAALLLCLAAVIAVVLLRERQLRQQQAAEETRLEQEWSEMERAAARQLLTKALQGIWTHGVEEDRNTHLELIFGEGTAEYNFRNIRYPEYDQTLLTYGWEAVDGQNIRLFYPEGGENLIEVTFTPAAGETPEQVTFRPAITSMEKSETWERSTP